MYILICESLKIGGVQSLFLRISKHIDSPVCIISLTNLKDDSFINDIEAAGVSYFFASDFLLFGKTRRATHINFFPLSKRKVRKIISSDNIKIHVSSLSGAVFAHRLIGTLTTLQKMCKLSIGVYNDFVFGWASDLGSYYSKLSKAVLFEHFGKGSVLFYNEKSRANLSAKVNAKLNGDIIPIGIEFNSDGFLDNKSRGINSFKLISVGRLVRYKSYNRHVIKAIYELKRAGYNIEFDIYGDGEEQQDLKKIVEDFGLVGTVTFKGTVKYSKLSTVFKSADGFVGCGTALLEAASYGIPCIIGIEDIEEPKTYGFLSDTHGLSYHDKGLGYNTLSFYEVLHNLINLNEREYLALRKKHLERVKAFDIAQTCNILRMVYENISEYRVAEVPVSVFRLQCSVILEQLTSIVGLNKGYQNKKKSESN